MREDLITELNGRDPDSVLFEVAIVYSKSPHNSKHKTEEGGDHSLKKDEPDCAIQRLKRELNNKGLLLEDIEGISSEHFLKIGAPIEVLGSMAETLEIRKPTYIGLDMPFQWNARDMFVRQYEDKSLFSWTERYECLHSLLYEEMVNDGEEQIFLKYPGEVGEFVWKPGESLLWRLETEKIVKELLILHDESKRKSLLHNWALKWSDFTHQPIDSIYSYFGPKVAIYFTFLGMYTQWLIYPAIMGILIYCTDLGTWESVVPPLFSTVAVTWAVLFLQFWKRKNAALLARWNQSSTFDKDYTMKLPISLEKSAAKMSNQGLSKTERQVFQEEEWAEHFRSFRNNATVIAGILCLQLPFEIAYAHLSYITKSSILRFTITGVYLLLIQYFTKLGGKFAVRLTKSQHHVNKIAEADSLIYKVFGVYFMQSYIGLFYQALFQRDFKMLRLFLIQRLVISQVINNIVENMLPYIAYRRNKYNVFHMEKDEKKDPDEKSRPHMPQVEKEYLKPVYTASIGDDLDDGLFDDFLELTLQFGMVTMFASAFPLVFVFGLINNLMEIRSDALKLLVMLRRPEPRAAASIGAWLNIFQFLGVMAICTNCALLVCLYDQQGTWTLEPGMAAILLMEHLLLLVKFGFSCFVPEEPAWVRAKRTSRKVVRDKYSRGLLQNLNVANPK